MDALQPGATRHDGGLDVVLEAVASLRGTVRDPDTGLPVVAAAVVAVDPAGEVVAPPHAPRPPRPDRRPRADGRVIDAG